MYVCSGCACGGVTEVVTVAKTETGGSAEKVLFTCANRLWFWREKYYIVQLSSSEKMFGCLLLPPARESPCLHDADTSSRSHHTPWCLESAHRKCTLLWWPPASQRVGASVCVFRRIISPLLELASPPNSSLPPPQPLPSRRLSPPVRPLSPLPLCLILWCHPAHLC
jgi:hypothetical protein